MELSRWLFLTGAVPFLVLGLVHVVKTPRRVDDRKGLSPLEPGLARVMSNTRLRLTKRTDMWLAWVGFNLSHSLGAILFGVLVLLIGRSESTFVSEAPVFGPVAVVVSGIYVLLGVRYWFHAPIVGCALSFALFVSSWVLRLAAT